MGYRNKRNGDQPFVRLARCPGFLLIFDPLCKDDRNAVAGFRGVHVPRVVAFWHPNYSQELSLALTQDLNARLGLKS